MRTTLYDGIVKFFGIIFIGLLTCSFTSFLITRIGNFNFQDVLFFVGLLITIGSIFSMTNGRPIGATVDNFTSKYVAIEDVEIEKMDKERLLRCVFISDKVGSTLVSSEWLVIGLIVTAISFFL